MSLWKGMSVSLSLLPSILGTAFLNSVARLSSWAMASGLALSAQRAAASHSIAVRAS